MAERETSSFLQSWFGDQPEFPSHCERCGQPIDPNYAFMLYANKAYDNGTWLRVCAKCMDDFAKWTGEL